MRTLCQFIGKFFCYSWRIINFSRRLFLNILFFILLVALLILWLTKHSSTPTSHGVQFLKFDLVGMLTDSPDQNKRVGKLLVRQLLGRNKDNNQENSLFYLVEALRQASDDEDIKGIVLDLDHFTGGDIPSMQYLGKALSQFKQHGKPIYAYSENYTQAQYFIASFADKVYLSPMGSIDLHGIATHSLYFKTLLDKLGVNSHVFRVGSFKSAVEPYLLDGMSDNARSADSRWVNQLWQNYLTTIAANRKITTEQVFPGAEAILAQLQFLKGDNAKYALSNHLVDELISREDFNQRIQAKFASSTASQPYHAVSIYNYSLKEPIEKGNIAVIVVNGEIIDGDSTENTSGGDTISKQIKTVYRKASIKALVLRINSPGGSVTASEKIRQALITVRKAGKPIVVSMSGLAASGGYWIALPANYIIASPSTLTGSIGIFGVINTIERLLNKIGVHSDGVSTSPLSDISSTKALPAITQQIIQLNINNAYQHFISLVADQRHKSVDEVNQIAQGHVWSGRDAKANGLVDMLGDFDDAVNKAQALAHLPRPLLSFTPVPSSLFNQLIQQFDLSMQSQLKDQWQGQVPSQLLPLFNQIKQQPGVLNHLTDPQHQYAYCLNCTVIF